MARHEFVGLQVTNVQVLRHGYWMGKLRVVESRICQADGGFGLGNEGFFGFGLGLGFTSARH